VIGATGTRSKIEYKPLPVDDPKVRQPDISRARSLLGWEPKVDVRVGVARTVEYFRSLLGSDRMLPRAEPAPRPAPVTHRGAA
jgi:dTDP-glucose 4,6-dehydratase